MDAGREEMGRKAKTVNRTSTWCDLPLWPQWSLKGGPEWAGVRQAPQEQQGSAPQGAAGSDLTSTALTHGPNVPSPAVSETG